MRTDKLAALATILAVFYIVLKEKGAPSAPRPTMPLPVAVYHPPARRPPIKVYYPPARHPPIHPFPIKVYYPPARHPPIRKSPVIHFPPILGHSFHPPTRRIGKYQPLGR